MGKGKKTNIDFEITIFLTEKSNVNSTYEMEYFRGKTKKGKNIVKKDKIILSENKINISGHRETSDIFFNLESNEFQTLYSSTLYKNIIKIICNYIILSRKLLFIEKILIKYNQFSLEYDSQKIHLFAENDKTPPVIPNLENVDSSFLFSSNKKSKKFFDSFLYFIQALNETESYYQFERLYRALNILMNYQGNTISDKNALDALKDLCSRNKENFESSINYLINTDANIYDKLRWSNFLKNKHNRKDRAIEILGTITNPDIISVIFRRRKNLKDEEIECMERNISSTTISWERKFDEYLDLILCNYIYFVRCSFFHGELNDAFFHLFEATKLKNEFDFINQFLILFLLDCYKNFSIFRDEEA